MARVWYRPVPTLLIRRRRPTGEPARLDGLGGAGRLSEALRALDIPIAEVAQVVIDHDGTIGELELIDLGPRFEIVALGSHLVNTPDPDRRRAYLALAARHLARGGRLLVEHHPIDWAETAEPTPSVPGSTLGMVEVRRHPPFVSAVSVFDSGDHVERQPFTALVLSETDLDATLAEAGLSRRARRSPTWLEAGR
jgi:hypothetical protein